MGTGAKTAWRAPDEYGTLAPWGVPLEVVPGRRGHPSLPLSLTVGAWLLSRRADLTSAPPAGSADATVAGTATVSVTATVAGTATVGGTVAVGMASVAADEPPAGCAAFGRDRCAPWLPRVALLVMGDGSAWRAEPPSGYADPRATVLDGMTAKALAAADLDGLLALDPALATELTAAGRPAWQALAGAAAGADWRAELLYDAAPYGVGYLVASWVRA
ncbi:hypothetical protein GCM10023322_16730 [Rugosimonospora acidiphila]|uniref:Uncharacterized protein n=1 Tax=Rugosimonospora acidiphila TaxID=556531 RepID=A0ABP9RP16_9ACTN